MWILPTHGRPDFCQQALDCFSRVGSTPGIVWMDEDEYPGLRIPDRWELVHGKGGPAQAYRYLVKRFPDADWYGFLADDNRPRSKNFDLELIKSAVPGCFVYCNGDGHKTVSYHEGDPLPQTIPSAMMWGGDLVRFVGWLAAPWANHATTDEVWKHLAMRSGVGRYRHDVIVGHVHWGSGGRKPDATDRRGTARLGKDIANLHAFMASSAFTDLVRRVRDRFSARLSPSVVV